MLPTAAAAWAARADGGVPSGTTFDHSLHAGCERAGEPLMDFDLAAGARTRPRQVSPCRHVHDMYIIRRSCQPDPRTRCLPRRRGRDRPIRPGACRSGLKVFVADSRAKLPQRSAICLFGIMSGPISDEKDAILPRTLNYTAPLRPPRMAQDIT